MWKTLWIHDWITGEKGTWYWEDHMIVNCIINWSKTVINGFTRQDQKYIEFIIQNLKNIKLF